MSTFDEERVMMTMMGMECVWVGREGVVPIGRSQSEPQKIRYPTLAAVVHAQ